MRIYFIFSLGLTLLCFACRGRAPVEEEKSADDPSAAVSTAASADVTNPAAMGQESVMMEATAEEGPIAMQPQMADRIESLSFAHGNNLCVQAGANGQTSLQPCDANAVGQRFLFARSLDGRVQLKDVNSQRCLAVGPIGFFVTELRAEVCESTSTQFFSVVDYGATYSLKFDRFNVCIDAEMSRAEPGTRLILFRCSAVLNQKIQTKKP